MTKQGIHNNSWRKSILLHGKWYLISSVLSKIITIFLLPVYTRYFTPEEYGILNSLNSIGQLVIIGISLYLDAAFGRFYHEIYNDKEKLKELVSTVYFFILVWGLFVAGIIVFTSVLWAPGLFGIAIWPYIVLAFVPLVFLQLGQIGIIYLQQKLKVKEATGLQLFYNLFGVSCTLILIIGLNMDIRARLIGNAIAGFMIFLIVTGMYIKQGFLAIRINFVKLKELLFYSLPLLPMVAGGWIANLSDRIIIAHYDSLASTGLYAFAFQIAYMGYIIQDSITRVSGPISISGLIHNKEVSLKKLMKLSKSLFIFMLCFCFGQFLFSQDIVLAILKMGKGDMEYLDSVILISIIALTYVFSSQTRLFSDIILFHKKTWVSSSGGLIMAVINFSLNLLFIPHYGRNAAAFTTVFATISYSVWIVFWAMRLEKFRIQYGFYLVSFAIYAILTGIIYFCLQDLLSFSWMNFFIKIGICLFILACIFFLYKKRYKKHSETSE